MYIQMSMAGSSKLVTFVYVNIFVVTKREIKDLITTIPILMNRCSAMASKPAYKEIRLICQKKEMYKKFQILENNEIEWKSIGGSEMREESMKWCI